MRHSLVYLAAIALSIPLSALAADPDMEPASGTGADLYRRYCSACHGLDGKGHGPVAAVLKDPPKDLTQIAATRGGVFPTAQVIRIIDGREVAVAHGSREMPVWGERFGEAVPPGTQAEAIRRGTAQLIADYLATIQAPATP